MSDPRAPSPRQMLTELAADLLDWMHYAEETGATETPWEPPEPPRAPHAAAAPAQAPVPTPRAPLPTIPRFDPLPDPPAPARARSQVPSQGDGLQAVRADLGNCQRCPLHTSRNHIVFGSGSPDASIMVIGEAPGFHEDKTGEPFVGRAGQLLTRMLAAIGVGRQEAYIANVIKCRPPENRDPVPEEIRTCSPFLSRQVEAIQPKVIVTVGRFASQTLLESNESMGRLRGQVHDWQGIPVVPTYHPAYLLRNAADKGKAWDDLRRVRDLLRA